MLSPSLRVGSGRPSPLAWYCSFPLSPFEAWRGAFLPLPCQVVVSRVFFCVVVPFLSFSIGQLNLLNITELEIQKPQNSSEVKSCQVKSDCCFPPLLAGSDAYTPPLLGGGAVPTSLSSSLWSGTIRAA